MNMLQLRFQISINLMQLFTALLRMNDSQNVFHTLRIRFLMIILLFFGYIKPIYTKPMQYKDCHKLSSFEGFWAIFQNSAVAKVALPPAKA